MAYRCQSKTQKRVEEERALQAKQAAAILTWQARAEAREHRVAATGGDEPGSSTSNPTPATPITPTPSTITAAVPTSDEAIAIVRTTTAAAAETATDKVNELAVTAAEGISKSGRGGVSSAHVDLVQELDNVADKAATLEFPASTNGGRQLLVRGQDDEQEKGDSTAPHSVPSPEEDRHKTKNKIDFLRTGVLDEKGLDPPRRHSYARPSTVSPARAEIERIKEEVGSLIVQAQEGLSFVRTSVDMADMLRGFAFTKHSIPVRDVARDGDERLLGRSVRRERYGRRQWVGGYD